jgi:Sulfotransferase domain.
MEARQLNIESKHRQHIVFVASLKDFSYTEGDLVNPSLLVDNPQISLYCLDDIGRKAIFVEIPPDVDLTKVAFVYQSQYEQAQKLIALPYETFNELANSLPEVQQPIFIYVTGRSGSTLLNHAFNESETVVSLSEPDVATQFVNLRHDTKGNRETELRTLAQSTIRFLFRSYHTKGVQAHALKFRNQGLQVMDLFQTTFPQAKNLFLYRDAIGYVTSFYRLMRKVEAPEYLSFDAWQSEYEKMLAVDLSHLSQYLDEANEEISLVEQITLSWIVVMEWYLVQFGRGSPVLAVRYADLIEAQEETLQQIFSYCGLPLNSLQLGLRAYGRDSQEGTLLARENSREGNKRMLNEAQMRSVTAILQRHPVLNISDFNVPGTLQISGDK